MKAELISVGTELLLGDILNTNAQYLSKELAALGITVHRQSVIGDNPDRLAQLVEDAKGRSELLLFTGGLGPTGDDLTKETVAGVFHDELVLDKGELDKIRMYFECRGGMPHNNEKQAMVPRRGQKIENTCGTAPGVLFRDEGCTAILMPGVPHEMRAMFERSVRGMLMQMAGGAIVSTMLHVFGPGESALEEMVGDLLQGANPTAALYAKNCEVAVRVTARGADEKAGRCAARRAGAELSRPAGRSDLQRGVGGAGERGGAAAGRQTPTAGDGRELYGRPAGPADHQRGRRLRDVRLRRGDLCRAIKRRILGVKPSTLKKYGAMSYCDSRGDGFRRPAGGKGRFRGGDHGHRGPGRRHGRQAGGHRLCGGQHAATRCG